MTTLKKNRTLQYGLWAEFVFNITDSMLQSDGVTTKAFNAASVAVGAIGLPQNAVVIGGDVTVETASDDTGTATISVGDSGSAVRYLGATSIKAAARTALVPTGYRGNGEDLLLTLANANGNAANGKVSVRVHYLVTGRAQEVQIA